jgi:hypothetical protein
MMCLGTIRAITNERARFVSRNGLQRLDLQSCRPAFLRLDD